ncbi:helix-turn-helix domain-containing protein [Sphaerisporangium corydalis]|uniref:Helix-turn-helix domain-containing protein n=1 Tax=Sphaerisporangium corydalis TaxID=1441875 RepID=A0ABV9EQJ2_9ACTN|nr:helix-turn-helix transcriptional regulator [Sphaerisporangium corydalis]
MPRGPDAVDGSISPWHLLGAALRQWRELAGLTLTETAPKVPIDPSLLAKWERGTRRPAEDAMRRLDQALNAGGILFTMYGFALANETPRPSPAIAERWDAETMDALRRQLLLGGFAAAGSAASAPFQDGLERLRSVVDQTVGDPGIDDFEELVWEYSHAIVARSQVEVLGDLAADVLALQKTMNCVPPRETSRWLRVNARMTNLLAHTLGSTGYARESRHWWTTARRAAERTGDQDVQAAAYASEAVQALHEDRPAVLVLDRADKALALSGGRACVATVEALGARSHALTLAGDVAQACATLDEQVRVFERLPSAVTSDLLSAEGWPTFRLLYSRSLVFTLAGHPSADRAQEEALASYPVGRPRQRAQVELHCAYSEVRRGHIDDGLGHARRVLTGLGDNVTRFVHHMALGVANAVPEVANTRSSVVEYRDLLALPAGRN